MSVIDLPGARRLTVRSSTRDDVCGLTRLYAELGDDDSYRRFFSAFHPDHGFIESMATVSEHGGDELVVVLSSPDEPDRIIAEAGYRILPDGNGELAMVIARGWRGWLGPYLLDALLRRAAAHGVPNLGADILATNGPMLALLARRGAASVHTGEWSVLRLLVGTSGTTPSWTGDHRRPRLLVEVPGGRWHAGDATRHAGFDVVACGGPRGLPTRCPALRGEVCPLVAGADVVVVCHARDDDTWRALEHAHATVHAAFPIVAEPAVADPAFVASLVALASAG